MQYHELDLTKTPDRKRVGRGRGSGYGKTAGRGTKGQNARSGGGVRLGFEGGQNPLMQRIPKKRGFRSIRRGVQEITTRQLALVSAKNISAATLLERGLIKDQYLPVKLILRGEPVAAYTIELDAATPGAISAIEKAGGKFTAKSNPRPKKADTPEPKK